MDDGQEHVERRVSEEGISSLVLASIHTLFCSFGWRVSPFLRYNCEKAFPPEEELSSEGGSATSSSSSRSSSSAGASLSGSESEDDDM
jgi:hypothetical protein